MPQSKIHINMIMFTLDMIICRKKVIVKIIKSKLNPKKKSKALNVTATGIIRGPKKIYESMAIFYKTSRKWLTVAIFRKWQDSIVALWIEIAVILSWR